MNRPVTATGVVPAASATRLSELWPTPAEARDWVVDVVGENIVTTCDTCRKDSVPCTGLLPKLNQESSSVTTDLQDLVSGTTQPTLANLEQVTAPGIALTRQVIEAIRRMPPSEQGLIIDRQVPEVCATEVARTHAERAIEELDRDIDSLLFETRVRKEVVSDTVATLLRRAAKAQRVNERAPGLAHRPETPEPWPGPVTISLPGGPGSWACPC